MISDEYLTTKLAWSVSACVWCVMISCQILSSVFRMGLEPICVNTKGMFKPLITVCAFCSTQLFIFGSQNRGGGRKMRLRIMKPGVVSLHHIELVGSVKSFALIIWLYVCQKLQFVCAEYRLWECYSFDIFVLVPANCGCMHIFLEWLLKRLNDDRGGEKCSLLC